MESARRLAYLEAMEITVWAPRPGGTRQAVAKDAKREEAMPAGPDARVPPWPELERQVAACTRCGLHATRTQTVFGVGHHEASLMLIGEAPGEQEDLQGEPFVGRAGMLLNEMLCAIGFAREQVYIANVLKCRPPNNRDPKPEEAAACEPFLRAQIDLVRPALILAIGRIAAQQLLATTRPIGQLRGRLHRYQQTPLLVLYHPAYLLRSPLEKRRAWEDLRHARKLLQQVVRP